MKRLVHVCKRRIIDTGAWFIAEMPNGLTEDKIDGDKVLATLGGLVKEFDQTIPTEVNFHPNDHNTPVVCRMGISGKILEVY